MPKVIILGAKGRFGRAALHAFRDAGWEVTAFARDWPEDQADHAVAIGDVTDTATLAAACAGQDVIVNAINPPYEKWAAVLPDITRSVIAAARASGATVIVPGNVYNYGADAPEVLREETPWRPTTRKGTLRATMEGAYRDAGVPTIVLRGGDFIEAAKTGNWFDSQIAAKARKGRTVYPGPLDRVHAWAYLPDMARAAVMLAERRDSLAPFTQVNFPGYALTGAELAEAIGQAVGRKQKIGGLPWWLIRILGLVQPAMREVMEMRYLWQVPHRLDGTRLHDLLPGFTPTPLPEAMKAVLTP